MFGFSNWNSFRLFMILIFVSAPESAEKPISMSRGWKFQFFGFIKHNGIVQTFSFDCGV